MAVVSGLGHASGRLIKLEMKKKRKEIEPRSSRWIGSGVNSGDANLSGAGGGGGGVAAKLRAVAMLPH